MTTTAKMYTPVAKCFHWGILLTIIFLFSTVPFMEADISPEARRMLFTGHKTAGLLVLFFTLLRIVWRFTHKPPKLPVNIMPRWQVRSAHIAHLTLYILTIATPLAGWAMVSASPYSIKLFGLLTIPKLPLLFDPSQIEYAHHFYEEVHEICAVLLAMTLVVHIGGAIWHHFVDRDDILLRMSPNALSGWLRNLR